jgi:FkbM family methyltransferase
MAARQSVSRQSRLIRRDGDLVLFQTPFGPSWISGAQPLELAQFRAPDLFHWPPRWAEDANRPFVGRGGVIIDGGGHIGESAATALKLGAARVISVEPDPINAEAIRRNLADAVTDGRLTVLQVGLWDRRGTLNLERGVASPQSEIHPEAHGPGAIDVPVTTIDQIVADLGLSRVDAIKLDIEGSETNALRGARDTLTRFKPKLAVGSYHREGDRRGIPEIVLGVRPDYRVRATRCLLAFGRVQPHELFFE